MTRLDQHLVQLAEQWPVGQVRDVGRQLGKLLAIVAGAQFVEHLAEAVDVGLARAGTFGRQKAFRADE